MAIKIQRILCKKCGRKVRDTFGSKLSHVLSEHSDAIIEDAILTGGDSIREKAYVLGRELRERFKASHHEMDS